jgi:type IV pilus assembly protein PilB
MGVEPYLIASSLRCVIAQRLVRKVCDHCAEETEPLAEDIALLKQHGITEYRLRRGIGCRNCDFTGYRGRLAIHEVLLVEGTLAKLILARKTDAEYVEAALESGMTPMMRDGLTKVAAGWTTTSEIFRVLAG